MEFSSTQAIRYKWQGKTIEAVDAVLNENVCVGFRSNNFKMDYTNNIVFRY